jgi:ribosomal protein S18 acetylase RimI-like enzyme
MSDSTFRIVQLSKEHDRAKRESFKSGSVPLDIYFKQYVTQDIRNNITKCFVALSGARIAGFYTLSADSIALEELPDDRKKRLRYEEIPAVRIGRLAVDKDFRGRHLGSLLLFDASRRVAEAPIGVYALSVDSKDEAAKGFYLHHGFVEMPDAPNSLFLPLAAVITSQ